MSRQPRFNTGADSNMQIIQRINDKTGEKVETGSKQSINGKNKQRVKNTAR